MSETASGFHVTAGWILQTESSYMDGEMIREQVEKLSDVLYYAQGCGTELLSSLGRWFEQISQDSVRETREDVTHLSDAAARVIRAMLVESQSPVTSPVFEAMCFPSNGPAAVMLLQHTSEDIQRMLLDELTNVC